MLRAIVYGVGAAIAGAGIYYAVIAITDLEIGLVAILIGYMVGWAVHRAVAGRGGRRFQILAVALTYWSVGLAYTPMTFKSFTEGKVDHPASATSAGADSVRSPRPAAPTSDTAARTAAVPRNDSSVLLGLGALFLVTFALPLFAVFGSLPSGLLSGLIIFFGLQRAWRMTAAPPLAVSGPYRIGAGPA